MLATYLLPLLGLAHIASAGMYPKSGAVKQVTANQWKEAMKEEITAITAFVAPWCGHCQRLTPEFSKAAESLAGIVPFYAVDCDAEENKQLCGEQGVRGFPTIKGFPRGKRGVPHDYQGERTANGLVDFAASEVPSRVKTLRSSTAIEDWTRSTEPKLPHVLLVTKSPKLPVLWKVLGWRHHKEVSFGATKDEKGEVIKALGVDAPADGKSKVLVWSVNATQPVVYKGILKFDPLNKYLKSLTKIQHTEL